MTISRSLTPDRSPAGAAGPGTVLAAGDSAEVAPAALVAGGRCGPSLAGSPAADRGGAAAGPARPAAGPEARAKPLPPRPAGSDERVGEELPAAAGPDAGEPAWPGSGAAGVAGPAGAVGPLPAPSAAPTPGFCPQPAATRTATATATGRRRNRTQPRVLTKPAAPPAGHRVRRRNWRRTRGPARN